MKLSKTEINQKKKKMEKKKKAQVNIRTFYLLNKQMPLLNSSSDLPLST